MAQVPSSERKLAEVATEELIADGGTKIMVRGAAELGDEEILIADGGTQVLERPVFTKKPASLPPPVPTKVSALDALAATIPAKPKLVPPPPATARIEELDADDLDEEQRVNATMPFRRIEVVETPRSASIPTAAYGSLPASPTTPNAGGRISTHLPTVVIQEARPTNRPASIAPIAIDVPVRAPADTTLKLPPVRVAPPKSNAAVVATIVVSSLALCAAAIIGLVALGSPSDDASATRSTTVAAKPREAKQSAIRSAVIETPETTPQKAAPAPGERDANGTPVFSASSLPTAPMDAPAPAQVAAASTPGPARPVARASKAPVAAPPPAPEPAPAPAPVAVAPPPRPTTGTIQVPAGLMTVMVDSDYKRVQGGSIVVTCGRHRVNAGRGTQSVDVPCGGAVSMM